MTVDYLSTEYIISYTKISFIYHFYEHFQKYWSSIGFIGAFDNFIETMNIYLCITLSIM